jgi:cytochrome P450
MGRLAGINVPLYETWKEAWDKVHAYVDIQILRALNATANKKKKTPNRYILLHEMAKQTQNPIELRSQNLNVFLMVRDTTSTLVANIIFHLARNPEIWRLLRAESLSLGGKDLTVETLKTLQMFKRVVYEIMCLQGSSGQVQRIAIRTLFYQPGVGKMGML